VHSNFFFARAIALTAAGRGRASKTPSIDVLWNGVWDAVSSIAVVVTYHDLRVEKEGIDVEQFDGEAGLFRLTRKRCLEVEPVDRLLGDLLYLLRGLRCERSRIARGSSMTSRNL
jgi:hypothetical protein